MPISRFTHVSITVNDLDRSLGFWSEVLEMRLLGRGEVAYPHLDEIIGLGPVRLAWAELEIPNGGMVELFQYLMPVGLPIHLRSCDPGSSHACFEVTDLDEMVDRCRSSGIVLRSSSPVRIAAGEWLDWRCIYMSDPDGYTVELVERPL